MHSEWIDQLSDYLDDELGPEERRALDAHLAECESCTAALADLRSIVSRLHELPAAMPTRDLWHGIESRLATSARPAPRRFIFTMPQLVAASLLLALFSGWAALRLVRQATPVSERAGVEAVAPPSMVVNAANPAAAAPGAPVAVALDDPEYDRAVAELEGALTKGRGQLDPATIAVVEDSLAVIDQAVQEARLALRDDPANAYLNGHFAQTRQRKLDLLRQAAALSVDTN